LKVGDSCNKKFFKSAKPYSKASCIAKLEENQGCNKTNQHNLEVICSQFYGKLFAAPTYMEANNRATDLSLAAIHDKLLDEMKFTLDKPIGMDELDSAVKALGRGKLLGPYGILAEFF